MQNTTSRLLQRLFREPVNGLTHAAGALLSVAALPTLIVPAATAGKNTHVVAFSVYGTSLVLLYAASALYHLLRVSERTVAVLRRIDHVMIYVLIAGTYTPVCMIVLPDAWGRMMLVGIWILAAIGFVFTILWIHAPRWLSTTLYVAMGWSVVAAAAPLVQALSPEGVFWLAAGGAFYTAGAVMYALKKPDPVPGWFGFHEIWHLFVLAGSFCHFMMMIESILPMQHR